MLPLVMALYAKLTHTLVYESIATCGRVLIYRLSPASSRVKFLNFWREIQIFFLLLSFTFTYLASLFSPCDCVYEGGGV